MSDAMCSGLLNWVLNSDTTPPPRVAHVSNINMRGHTDINNQSQRPVDDD